jgi:hypothetical protein
MNNELTLKLFDISIPHKVYKTRFIDLGYFFTILGTIIGYLFLGFTYAFPHNMTTAWLLMGALIFIPMIIAHAKNNQENKTEIPKDMLNIIYESLQPKDSEIYNNSLYPEERSIGEDYIYNPAYDFLPCNMYYDRDHNR